MGTTPADMGNGLLAETPANLTTSLANTPSGQRMVMTIRTPSATVSVFLNGQDAQRWGDQIRGLAAQMSSAGLIVAGPGLPDGNGVPR